MTVAIQSKPKLITTKTIFVDDEGENVRLRVGNSVLTMHYEDALTISQLLRLHGKAAKRRAGDTSRHWSVIGTLENLTP